MAARRPTRPISTSCRQSRRRHDQGGDPLGGSPEPFRFPEPSQFDWLGLRGLRSLFLATSTTLLRSALGVDGSFRERALSFLAAPFVIAIVVPGIAELLDLWAEGASMIGALLGLVARPLIEAPLHTARSLKRELLPLLRARLLKH